MRRSLEHNTWGKTDTITDIVLVIAMPVQFSVF